jgi:hypothetical protein
MYSRTWHGATPVAFRKAFEKYEYETGVKDTRKIAGNAGASLRVIERGGWAHFFLCTLWDSMESMREYAGAEPEIAVDYPEDARYGLISDPIVVIQEVLSGRNNITNQ